MRKDFEMTEEDLETLMQAAKPVVPEKSIRNLTACTTPQPCPRCHELEDQCHTQHSSSAVASLIRERDELQAERDRLTTKLTHAFETIDTKAGEVSRAEAVIKTCKEYVEATAIAYPKNAKHILTAIADYQKGVKS